MKKMLLIAAPVLLCFFVSCKDAEKEKADQMKAANAAIYKAVETGDVSKVDSFIAKDAIDHGMDVKDVVGVDNIKKSLGEMHSQFTNMKIEVVSAAVDGDMSLTLTRMTGTPTAPAGAPAVNTLSVDVVKWKDGKAVEHWGYSDPRDMMKMMAPSNAPAMAPAAATPEKK